jgi:hypothetical protein
MAKNNEDLFLLSSQKTGVLSTNVTYSPQILLYCPYGTPQYQFRTVEFEAPK